MVMVDRAVGCSGLRTSLVGLGCNGLGGRIDAESGRRIVHAALDIGVTLFDTADFYGGRGGSEEALGQALGARRQDAIIATKFGLPMDDSGRSEGASRRYIFEAVESSLRRLGTDWIDIYQMHVPDPTTPIEETLGALHDLALQGKIRHAGCSNVPGHDLDAAQAMATSMGSQGFVSGQYEYNILARDLEAEVLPALQRHGMGLFPYFPLACGLLTGRYQSEGDVPVGSRLRARPEVALRYMQPSVWAAVGDLAALCRQTGTDMLDIAWGWLGASPVVSSVIAGVSSAEQLVANVEAASAGSRIDPGILSRVDRIFENSPAL